MYDIIIVYEYNLAFAERIDVIMQNHDKKRLGLQHNAITVTGLLLTVFVLTWVINTGVTGRKNGLYAGGKKKAEKTDASVSRAADESSAPDSSSAPITTSVAADNNTSSIEDANPYDGAAMKDDFSDACFIGDSRTVGLELNSDKAKADFYASQGLNISTALTDTFVTLDNGTSGTVVDGAAQKPYKRIFIMFGINELGWPYPETFVDQYVELVTEVQKAQPDAEIYIQSILPVSYKAAETNEVFTNENIDSFNEYVKRVADTTGTKYLDINEYFKDASGSLPEDAAADGIHFVRDYCLEWIDILAYLAPQDPQAAADIAAAQAASESQAQQDAANNVGDSYDDTADEAIGEYGFEDPSGYDTPADGGNTDYGNGYSDWTDGYSENYDYNV